MTKEVGGARARHPAEDRNKLLDLLPKVHVDFSFSGTNLGMQNEPHAKTG